MYIWEYTDVHMHGYALYTVRSRPHTFAFAASNYIPLRPSVVWPLPRMQVLLWGKIRRIIPRLHLETNGDHLTRTNATLLDQGSVLSLIHI